MLEAKKDKENPVAQKLYQVFEAGSSFFGAASDMIVLPVVGVYGVLLPNVTVLDVVDRFIENNFGKKVSSAAKYGAVAGTAVGCYSLALIANSAFSAIGEMAPHFANGIGVSQSTPASCHAEAVKAELEKIKAQGFVVSCPTPEAK